MFLRYGFLSENASFAEACEQAGIRFVGPPSGAIERMGDKIASKKIAADAGVHTIPGFKVRRCLTCLLGAPGSGLGRHQWLALLCHEWCSAVARGV